jgi:hypothetical protein
MIKIYIPCMFYAQMRTACLIYVVFFASTYLLLCNWLDQQNGLIYLDLFMYAIGYNQIFKFHYLADLLMRHLLA